MSFSLAGAGKPADVAAQLQAAHVTDRLGAAVRDALAEQFRQVGEDRIEGETGGYVYAYWVEAFGSCDGPVSLTVLVKGSYIASVT